MFFKSRSPKKKPLKIKNLRPWRFWREPLIHFFTLGLAVFGLHAALDRKPEARVVEWTRQVYVWLPRGLHP
jgi:hypothetical protein